MPATVLHHDDDLVAAIPRIADAGFVLVRGAENRVSGIVTTSDLSLLFSGLASPFIMLGEIERRLRRINGRVYSLQELKAARVAGDDGREVAGPADLTLGEHERLMESPANWARYGWDLDRAEFTKALGAVRRIRNEVMHFNTDPLTADQLAELSAFLKWIRSLDTLGPR